MFQQRSGWVFELCVSFWFSIWAASLRDWWTSASKGWSTREKEDPDSEGRTSNHYDLTLFYFPASLQSLEISQAKVHYLYTQYTIFIPLKSNGMIFFLFAIPRTSFEPWCQWESANPPAWCKYGKTYSVINIIPGHTHTFFPPYTPVIQEPCAH